MSAQRQMKIVEPNPAKGMEVKQTTNYELFQFAPHNRKRKESHVNGLMESIERHNYTREYPVLVTPDMVIFDGQHRFEACRRLEYPIFYRVIRVDDMEAIIDINHHVMRWSFEDYLNYLAANGNTHAAKILDDALEYGVSANTVASIAFGRNNFLKKGHGHGSALHQLSRLKYTKHHQQLVAEFFDRLEAFREYKFICKAMFIQGLAQFMRHPRYSHARMEKQIQEWGGKLKPQSSREGWVFALTELYNYRASKTERLNFRYDLPESERYA